MSDSKAKMLQIRFRLGLRPRPRLGNLSSPPDPIAELRDQLLKGGNGRGRVSSSPAPQFQNPKTATATTIYHHRRLYFIGVIFNQYTAYGQLLNLRIRFHNPGFRDWFTNKVHDMRVYLRKLKAMFVSKPTSWSRQPRRKYNYEHNQSHICLFLQICYRP